MEIFTMKQHKKLLAIAMITCILACSIGGAIIIEDKEETQESDGELIILGMMAVVAISAFLLGHFLPDWNNHNTGTDPTYVRGVQAQVVQMQTNLASVFYENMLYNYSQIWGLTNEHWIRMSELAASFLWEEGASYDPYTILTNAGVYLNSSNMLINSSNQYNEYLDSISELMSADWATSSTYNDLMTLKWVYGTQSISSSDSFGGHIASTISVTSEDHDTAYLNTGDLYVFGGTGTITNGTTTYTLSEGYNNLSLIDGFTPDVYEFQSGRQYAGSILPVFDAESITVNSGMVLEAGTTMKLATYSNGSVIIDNVSYSSLSIQCVPSGATTQTAVIQSNAGGEDDYSLLADYETMIRTVENTMTDANNAAGTVWNIYNTCGQASSYLTTLMVPNEYDNVSLSSAQQEIITILAMKELSDTYATSGEIKTSDYTFTSDSMSFFVRGDIYSNQLDKNGEKVKLYENVIYTPFYYTSDQTLSDGNNVQTQTSIVAIWDNSGDNLSSWDATSNISTMALVTVEPGYNTYIYEMEYGGETVSTQNLTLKNIDIINPGEINPHPIPDPPTTGTDWTLIILIVVGIIALLACIFIKPIRIPAGIVALICFGLWVIWYYIPTINIWSFL